MIKSRDKIVIFLGYHWKSSMNLRAFLAAVLENDPRIEVLYDLKEIEAGDKIHDEISKCIDACDCYITTVNSLQSFEVTSEVIIAKERGKFILTLHEGNELSPYPAHLPFLHDCLHLIYADYDELKRKLLDWISNKNKFFFGQSNSAVRNLQKEISFFDSTSQPYQRELLHRILDETIREIKEIKSNKYTLNVGFEKNFLFRSRAIFSTALNVWAISIDKVSTFWSKSKESKTQTIAEDYIDSQPSSTHRLFVFSSPKEANRYKNILHRNHKSYGGKGGVYMCSEESYDKILAEISIASNEKNADFAILQYSNDIYLKAILTSSELSFEQIDISKPGKYRYKSFFDFFNQFSSLDSYEVYSNNSPVKKEIRVKRWNPDCLLDNEQWKEDLNYLFPEEVSGDIYHILFFKDNDGRLADAIQTVKNNISNNKEAYQVEYLWFGKKSNGEKYTDFGWQGSLNIQKEYDYILIIRFTNKEYLKAYYEGQKHSKMRENFYRKLDPAISLLLDVAKEQGDKEKGIMYNVAIERLVSEYMVRHDFIDQEGVESVVGEKPIPFNITYNGE